MQEDVFRLPHNTIRLMCGNCAMVETWPKHQEFQCIHCGHKEAIDSTSFESYWATHYKNKETLEAAEALVAELTAEISKFEKDWYRTWNTNKTSQLEFEPPALIGTDGRFTS